MHQITTQHGSRDQLPVVIVDKAALDTDGGISLSRLSGHVRIENPSIRSIDLVDCPDLVGIDLSACSDGLHLRLVELTELRWIRLPNGPTGCKIDLKLATRFAPISPLTIEGLIADFWLCANWLLHPWCLDELEVEAPLDGLFLGSPGARLSHQRADIHILIGRAIRHQRLELDCRGVGRLLLMGVQAEEMHLNNASLSLLCMNECPKLRAVTGRFQACRAELSQCRRLRRISGSGQRLNLGGLHTETLALDGRWLQTSMTDCETQRLALQCCTRLQMKRLPGLQSIDSVEPYEIELSRDMFGPAELAARLGSRPGKLDEFVREQMHRVGQRNALSTHWLENLALVQDPSTLTSTLSALFDIAHNPVDRQSAWLIRCALVCLHLHGKGSLKRVVFNGSRRWEWPLDRTDPIACWTSDIALYLRCRKLPITAPFRRTLESLDRIAPACALAQTIDANAMPTSDLIDCRRWLAGCIKRLNLQHPDDSAVIVDSDGQQTQPMQGMAGRLLASHRERQQRLGLPALGRTLAAWSDPEPAELLARAVMQQLPDRGLLLIELGVAYAQAGKQAGPELIAAGLATGITLASHQHAQAIRHLLRNQPAQS